MGINLALLSVLLVSVSLALPSKIDKTSTDSRIIGGFEATPGQFPYQISLRLADTSRHLCGGSVISDRWIITAAHCTQGRYSNISNLFVVTGAHNIKYGGDKYQLSQIINHPGYGSYESKLENDISLLQTATEIVFSENVRVIALRSKHVDGGVRAVVSGWGQSDVSFLLFKSYLLGKLTCFPWILTGRTFLFGVEWTTSRKSKIFTSLYNGE